MRAYLRDLITLFEWADSIRLPLDERMSSLVGLNHHEITSLGKALSKTVSGDDAAPSTINRRIAAIVLYLRFSFEHYIDIALPDYAKSNVGQQKMASVCGQLLALALDQGIVASSSRPSENLSEQQLAAIDEVMQPNSAHNPFTDQLVRQRNYCIARVAISTWARRSELVLISLGDVDLGPTPSIMIRKATDRSRDQRRDGASLKTRGRVIPISRIDADLLSTYLEDIRPGFVQSAHPSTELFLSKRDGKRLSAKTLNDVLMRVARAVQEIGMVDLARLHPHAIRKAGTDHFLDAHEPTSADYRSVIDNMSYKAGWSPASKMPQHYARDAMSTQLGRRVRGEDRKQKKHE